MKRQFWHFKWWVTRAVVAIKKILWIDNPVYHGEIIKYKYGEYVTLSDVFTVKDIKEAVRQLKAENCTGPMMALWANGDGTYSKITQEEYMRRIAMLRELLN